MSRDVKCQFKGRPRPQITWYKQGSNLKTFNHTEEVEKLQDSGIFKVTTTLHVPGRQEFTGIYQCFGNNSLSSGWSSSKEPNEGIELLFRCSGIYITRSGPEEIAASAFSNITLSCLVPKTVAELDDLRVTWNFKNQSDPLKTGGKYRIPGLEPISSCRRAFKLEIIKVTADDEGVYSCHQSCKYGVTDYCKSSAQVELKVYSPPPKEYPTPTTRSASSANEPKCEISCRVGDGPEDEETVDPDSFIPSHCSIKNGGKISRNMTWKEVNDKITPKPGVQCLVLKTGNSEKRIYFASPLTVTRWGSPAYLHANQMNRNDVKCEFKGRPRPQITWYKDGSHLKTFNHTEEVEKLQDSGIFKVTTTLHVPGREEFAGIYRCFGNNSLSSGWSSSKEPKDGIELLFRCSGIYITRSGPEEISASAFSNITLSCLVAKNAAELDDLWVTWNFKNQSDPLKTGRKYRIPGLEPISSCRRAFKLEIIKVTADDEGVYSCHQSCKYGVTDYCKSSAQLELKVYSPPPKEYPTPTTKTVSYSTKAGNNTSSEAAEATTVSTTEATTVSTTEATTVSTTEATTVSTTDALDVLQSVQGKPTCSLMIALIICAVCGGVFALVLRVAWHVKKKRMLKNIKSYLEEGTQNEKLFISCSSKDFSWVTENLIPPLEKHAIPYSIHSRDFGLGRLGVW
ncbi:PREDICTED: hemicentin-1-like [Acropora digitifera]|uniref:hemicentin-1-like n=1 Tax=Acropora digitifera TaxID=70779 RepID=UPI00077A4F4D|nr:PREDICTED: hemicentin-1-like [Acropora digitifera]